MHPLAPITGPGSCGAEDVVRLDAVVLKDGQRIALAPAATLRCPMAEAVAHWIREEVTPAAATFGSPAHTIITGTSYECRGRDRVPGAKLSEHGRANALDLRGLRLANGTVVDFTDNAVPKEFRELIRQSACTRFTTVLGPGSDAYHAGHIHLDLIERQGGYRLCQWDVLAAPEAPSAPQPPKQPSGLIPSPRERDSHAGDSQGEGNMIHRGKREGVCHGGCGSSSQGLRGRANTRAGEAV